MTRSKTSSYSPKLIRKEEKQLSKQAVKEGRIDRQTIIAQSFRYRRELVQNSIKLADWRIDAQRARQSASPRLDLDETKNALGYTLWSGPYKCAEGTFLDETEDLSDDGWEDEVQTLDEDRRPAATVEIAILDIATPAKPKGVAKEFEVVRGPRSIIVLEDDGYSDTEEEWEKLYEERGPRAMYSAVLQGVGG